MLVWWFAVVLLMGVLCNLMVRGIAYVVCWFGLVMFCLVICLCCLELLGLWVWLVCFV